MEDLAINKKRIRDSAPYRKTIAMSELDLQRATELERMYPTMFPSDAPFNFSKVMSKAIEVAYHQALLSPSLSTKDVPGESLKTCEHSKSSHEQSKPSSSKPPIYKCVNNHRKKKR